MSLTRRQKLRLIDVEIKALEPYLSAFIPCKNRPATEDVSGIVLRYLQLIEDREIINIQVDEGRSLDSW